MTPMELFEEVRKEVSPARELEARTGGRDEQDNPGLFQCFHVVHTPTSVFVQDRQPERTNRIVRKYLRHQDHFLRVNFRFVDASTLPFRPRPTLTSSADPRQVGGVSQLPSRPRRSVRCFPQGTSRRCFKEWNRHRREEMGRFGLLRFSSEGA